MSDTTTKRERREMKFDPATMTASIEGIGEFDATGLPDAVRTDLMGVGILTVLGRAKDAQETFAEMKAGTWRTRGPAAPRPLTDWQRAIAAVRADDTVKARRHAGEKITNEIKATAAEEADTYVRGLTPAQVAWARGASAVKIKHAELTGEDRSLDAMPAPDKVGIPEREAAE